MKKSLLVLSSFILVNCGGDDILNLQEESTAPKISNKQILIQSKASSLENMAETVVMDLSFETGIIGEGGGCSFDYIVTAGGASRTSTQCYGPNPLYQNGYLIRGYGKPRRASKMRSESWFGVKLEAKNFPKTIISRGLTQLVNDQESNAISIEFPFQANVTYEINLKTQLTDYVKVIKSPSSGLHTTSLADRYKDIDGSEAFPNLDIQLVDNPIILGDDPCADKPVVQSELLGSANYIRRQKAEKTIHWAREDKDFLVYFSTTEAKNAILIKFLPGITEERYPPHVPKSWFWLDIKNIKIVQKPFDPIHVVPPRVITPDPTLPCGFRGGC